MGSIFFGILLLGFASNSVLAQFGNSSSGNLQNEHTGRNLLVVLVADMEADSTELMAIWHVAQTGNELIWNPIYPSPFDESGAPYAQEHKALFIEWNSEMDWNELSLVQNSNLIWETSVVLDRAGLDALAGSSNLIIADAMPNSWANPQMALADHVRLIQSWCELVPTSDVLDLAITLNMDQAGIASDLGQFELIWIWDQLYAGSDRVSCLHPWAEK
jgi:hypothetical protein